MISHRFTNAISLLCIFTLVSSLPTFNPIDVMHVDLPQAPHVHMHASDQVHHSSSSYTPSQHSSPLPYHPSSSPPPDVPYHLSISPPPHELLHSISEPSAITDFEPHPPALDAQLQKDLDKYQKSIFSYSNHVSQYLHSKAVPGSISVSSILDIYVSFSAHLKTFFTQWQYILLPKQQKQELFIQLAKDHIAQLILSLYPARYNPKALVDYHLPFFFGKNTDSSLDSNLQSRILPSTTPIHIPVKEVTTGFLKQLDEFQQSHPNVVYVPDSKGFNSIYYVKQDYESKMTGLGGIMAFDPSIKLSKVSEELLLQRNQIHVSQEELKKFIDTLEVLLQPMIDLYKSSFY